MSVSNRRLEVAIPLSSPCPHFFNKYTRILSNFAGELTYEKWVNNIMKTSVTDDGSGREGAVHVRSLTKLRSAAEMWMWET